MNDLNNYKNVEPLALMEELELMQDELEQKDTQIREMQAELEQLPTLSEWQKVQALLQEQVMQLQEQSSTIRQQAENIEKLNADDRCLTENRQLKKENEHLAARLQETENERDYALAKVEIAKTQMRVEHVKVPTYYEKCDSCDKYWLERQIEKLEERYKKQRSFLRAFEVLVVIVIVFTAYQEEVFWKDFKQFFLGLWKVMCVVGTAVYNGYSRATEFITGGIQNATVQSVLYWILLVLLFALTVGGLYLIFRWMWNESKEKLMKARNPYTVAVIILLLLVVVYLGEFVKLLLPINLVGLWLLGIIVIIGLSIYVVECIRNRK